MSDNVELTQLLKDASSGDSKAASELLPQLYKELRSMAASRLRKIPPGQTLQATALVHEAYLRIIDAGSFEDRRHFFFAASRAMRWILVENARRKSSLKHGGDRQRVSIDAIDLEVNFNAPTDDFICLDEALLKLEKEYPRKHQLVMLRFFGGLDEEESAEILGVTTRTVRRDWRFARTWLEQTIVGKPASSEHTDDTSKDTGADGSCTPE